MRKEVAMHPAVHGVVRVVGPWMPSKGQPEAKNGRKVERDGWLASTQISPPQQAQERDKVEVDLCCAKDAWGQQHNSCAGFAMDEKEAE